MAAISGKVDPQVVRIEFKDIVEALAKGMRDFQAAPLYGLMLGSLYAAGGILILLCLTWLEMTYFAYPLATGFVLIGPFVAAFLYEVSRRLEDGRLLSFSDMWRTIRSRGEIGWLAFITVFFLVVWMYQVRLLMALFLGHSGAFATMPEFIDVVLTTSSGWMFLAIGNVIGAFLALVLFSITVVSFPLVLDRDVDVVTAMITSIRAVSTSPVPLIIWAGIVVLLLALSALPFFLGLIVTLPVLGHTTWHLYRRLVVQNSSADLA